ncbi:MAG: hypothetical protein ACOZDY_14600 [Pseudomonadota bacterium]
MKLSERDWPHLRGTLFFGIAVIAAGVIAIWLSEKHVTNMQREQAILQEQVAQARARLSRIQEERRDLDAYYEEYRQLMERGVIGPEQRLSWIETIDRLRDQRGLFGTRYSIAPQKPFQSDVPLPGGPINLRSSDMTLQLTLLHEGELADFLEALQREARGMYLLRGCRVERVDPAVTLRYAPHLRADCDLTWLSLNQETRR